MASKMDMDDGLTSLAQIRAIGEVLDGTWGGTKVEVTTDQLFMLLNTAAALHRLVDLQPRCTDCSEGKQLLATWHDSEHEPVCDEHVKGLHHSVELKTAAFVRKYLEWFSEGPVDGTG